MGKRKTKDRGGADGWGGRGGGGGVKDGSTRMNRNNISQKSPE